jgi:hypothetical protein
MRGNGRFHEEFFTGRRSRAASECYTSGMTPVEIVGELQDAPGMGERRLPGLEITGADDGGRARGDSGPAERPQSSSHQKNGKAMESWQP